jgi:hypothetical protein
MGVGGFRDSESGLDPINGLLEHVSLELGNILVETVRAGNDAGNRWYNSVKAGGSVITELDVGATGGISVIHLKNFNYNWVMSRTSRSATVTARI